MKTTMIVPAALAFALVGSTGAFAQTNNKYDPTGGDHMYSYGAQTPAAPAKHVSEHHTKPAPMMNVPQVQYDRTGDHMNSYAPAAQ
jgi:hypothetical protein